ncbi:MAG: OsmC family protein [Candidatus Omnitrophica bacterium]|nr:OsmC family protein [Candidatus Omnitrophota bacterium]MDD5440804.1 OsmC family protein [Candidatus Omnitrophota bacterium]
MNIETEVIHLNNDVYEVGTSPSGVTFYIDKKKDGVTPEGPNPLELFLSSLAGCIAMFAKNYFSMNDLEYSELKVRSFARLSDDSPKRLVDIKVKIITDADVSGKKEVFYRFIENCIVHNTIIKTECVDIELIS